MQRKKVGVQKREKLDSGNQASHRNTEELGSWVPGTLVQLVVEGLGLVIPKVLEASILGVLAETTIWFTAFVSVM